MKLGIARQNSESICLSHLMYGSIHDDSYTRLPAFFLQQGHDLACRSVAEQLSLMLLVIGNPVYLDQGNKVSGRVTRQRRLREMRIGRNKIFWPAIQVGEIVPAAARNQDLLADVLGALKHQHAATPLTCFDGAHQPGRARAQHDRVELVSHGRVEAGGLPIRDEMLAETNRLVFPEPQGPEIEQKKRGQNDWPLL